jgi:hypothetical protein
MKTALALAFLVAVFARSAFAFDLSPPTPTKDKSVAVKTVPTASVSQAQNVTPLRFDTAVSMPVEQIFVAGEKTKAEAIARRAPVTSEPYIEQWIADVPTPPNKTAFNGFANTRAREQV